MSERMRSVRRVDAVKLTRNSVTSRWRMPQRFPANSDSQTRHANLAHVNDHGSVRTLRMMVSRAGRMMWMRLMCTVDIVMRIVQAMVGAVNIVMGTMEAVMGVVNGLMGIMSW